LAGNLFGLAVTPYTFAAHKNWLNAKQHPRVAIIIDDIGFSPSRAWEFLRLNIPVTFSILPRTPYAQDLAFDIHNDGHEIMLHQPMEPYDIGIDPGPGALYVGDDPETISRTIQRNISEVPFATGVNNHMGSRFTASKKAVDLALRVIQHWDLYFVDSVTCHESKAYRTAKSLHMTTAFRDTFLDIRPDERAIRYQLIRLREHAQKYGFAIGIGHPRPPTAQAIRGFFKSHLGSDITLVHVSEIIRS
jgi:polysaccharide deacetylase 2 family uncharacterized protein YibQ